MANALNTGMNMADVKSAQSIRDSLSRRFGETVAVDDNLAGLDELARLAGRRVRPGNLPDQRVPRPFGEGERDARAAAAGHSGGGADGRLAGGRGPHQPAAVVVKHRARGPI